MRACVLNLPVSMSSSEEEFLFAFLVQNTLKDITVPQKWDCDIRKPPQKENFTLNIYTWNRGCKKNTHFPVFFSSHPL